MITAEQVTQAYDLTEPSAAWLGVVVGAVNAWVDRLPDIARTETTEEVDGIPVVTTSWAEDTELGALMLAARLYDRRDSRGGVVNIGDSVSYIARHDVDIARMLRLDSYAKPKVS